MAAVRARPVAWAALGFAVLLVIPYASVLDGDFVWDDVGLIAQNRSLTDPGGLRRLFTHDLWGSAGRGATQLYHPLPMFTFWLQVQLTGLAMVPLRLGNVGLHALSTWLLFLLLRRLGIDLRVAFGACATFALHPLTTEPVMWLTGRHDTVGSAFSLAALLLLPPPDAPARAAALRSLAAALACALAFASKEPFVVAPALLAVLALLEAPSLLGWKGLVVRVSPSILAVLGVFGIRHALGVSSASRQMHASLLDHLTHYGSLLAHYALLGASFRDGPTIATYVPLGVTQATGVLLLAAGCVALALHAIGRTWPAPAPWSRALLLGVVWYGLALAPHVLSLPVVGIWGNRYGYFPWMGAVVALAALSARVLENPSTPLLRALAVGLSVLLSYEAWATHRAALKWRDDLALYGDSVARNPRDGRALYHLAFAVQRREGCGRALALFARAAALDPRYPRAQRNHAACLLQLGRPAEAIAPAARAVALEPSVAAHRYNLGAALVLSGDVPRGRAELETALHLDPAHRGARSLLDDLARGRVPPVSPRVP